MKLFEVKIGDTFKVADIEFIKFAQDVDKVVAVAKECLFRAAFGKNNNFAESVLLEKLVSEVLLKIEAAVGADKVLEFETDLLSLDGDKVYGALTSKISLPTFDFYRQNVDLFDKYKLYTWWWLATPDSTEKHDGDGWVVCVSPVGYIDRGYYDGKYIGVRPFLIFESSISVSDDEK